MAPIKRPVGPRLPPTAAAGAGPAAASAASAASAGARPAVAATSTAAPAAEAVTTVITRFGVLGVFLLMVPESAGIPIPSEVTLLFSGFAVSQGWMSLPLAILAATAGNVVGSLIAYGIGATHVLERVPGARSLLARSARLLDDR